MRRAWTYSQNVGAMLDHKRITVITGAAGTLGTAIARRLLSPELHLLLVDLDGDALHNLATEFGDRATVVIADATDEGQVASYLGQTASCRIVGLVNNVGGEGDAVTIPEHSIESFEHTLRLNVTSALIHMKHVIPRMVEGGGGSIVNMGSVSSVLGNPRDVAYTVAKHGVIGLTRAGAAEWGHRGIRVNAVCPAPIESPMMAAFEASQGRTGQETRTWYTGQTPARRYGRPEEVADAIAFLLSDQAQYVNGSVVMLDGGLTASGRPAV